jgi:hypothetical protein
MPRTAGIDIPDVLHHVIVRGIEKYPILLDDQDHLSFVSLSAAILCIPVKPPLKEHSATTRLIFIAL